MNTYNKKNRFKHTSLPVASRLNGKTVLAIILVIMLVFMWMRIFINKGKNVDEAAAAMEQLHAQQENNDTTDFNLVYVELPFEKGRHDAIENDLFVPKDFYEKQKPSEVKTNTGNDKGRISKNQVSAILRHLDVGAIIKRNDSPGYKAFINGNLLKDGEILSVKFGGNSFELKVLEILSDEVIFDCNETIISFKMSQLEKSN